MYFSLQYIYALYSSISTNEMFKITEQAKKLTTEFVLSKLNISFVLIEKYKAYSKVHIYNTCIHK